MMVLTFLIVNFTIRLGLMFVSFGEIDLHIFIILKMFWVGFLYDLITSFYYFSPLAIYLLVIPQKVYNLKIHRVILFMISIIIIFLMLFNGVSEYFFWEEFGKRFNFIAVDYLVYTHEVIKNIQESYPVGFIIVALFLISFMIVFYFRNKFFVQNDNSTFIYRLKIVSMILIFPILFFNTFDKQPFSKISDNIYNNELAKDGIYSLFSAFRHNQLDYNEFYKTIDNKEMFQNLNILEKFDDKRAKIFRSQKQENRKNIILIMVESLSAKYMGVYGNSKNLTPHLDKLTKEALFFDNLFATGTRTVRGMEAVNLSIPPTPGRSIVKRLKNDKLDSFGKILKEKGYENKFIYAGHGYFDNMNNFFSKNGFEIVDRLNFDSSEVTFSNVWGVCDEDLLNKVIKEADKSYNNSRMFFSFVMTTSNHRPYTYPENRIDIPSHTGRDGAVKYTDFAIDKFLSNAKKKPWFKDTIFVIVADHNGGSAGKTSLPLYRYKIPFIIYAPDMIEPKIVSKLASQIDTMPTILSLLGLSYKAKFYGNNILDEDFVQRAFISNYQKLGYVKNGYLYYLTPDKKIHKMKIEELSLNGVEYSEDKNITKKEEDEIITYYQSASYLYTTTK